MTYYPVASEHCLAPGRPAVLAYGIELRRPGCLAANSPVP